MIAIIAAMAKNRVIGHNGKIPWDIPEDREHFKKLTMGNIVVMGRKTYEEIGHPLPGRTTYLVSATKQVEEKNCHTVQSLREVVERERGQNIFICGGVGLYKEAMKVADCIYLTELDAEVEGDTLFPVIEPEVFRCIRSERGNGAYSFRLYERKG
ncbi:MAG: dihydrofolate reductase [Lachnospiraceae bacterium]|nr:dihydrofolate reductase [Lachnospiraceae bacterium]